MSSESWFYAHDGEQHGPVTTAVLQEMAGTGRLGREDLVWSEGMEEWVPAGSRAELFGFGGAEPAAAPTATVGYATPASLSYFHGGALPAEYAGFWHRFVAFIIDGVILWIPGFLFQIAVRSLAVVKPAVPFHSRSIIVFAPAAGLWGADVVVRWLYYALFEASHFQATPGKMALGLVVTDETGHRIGFGRATGRYFAKLISALILYIGFMMAGWTEKKQALHDILASTLVLKKRVA